MRIVFMGTPEFSVPTLKRIVDEGHHVVVAYTRAPKPAGRRGLQIRKTPVHQTADTLGIPVRTPSSLRDSTTQDQFQALAADLLIVIAYGLILPKPVLEAPRYGCLNLHASLLPRWRGAAPIQRAIMAGDTETGIDLMRMEEGLDTGPIALRRVTPIRPQDTAGDLAGRLAEIAANVAAAGLDALGQRKLAFQDQADTGASYAHKISKSEAEIDWRRPAVDVRNQIHGLSPAPGAFSTLAIGDRTERIKIYRAECVSGHGAPGAVLSDDMTVACGEDSIRILEGQRAGRTPVSGRDLLSGNTGGGAAFARSPET
jgi:methionyl-tRNA formyltransferase